MVVLDADKSVVSWEYEPVCISYKSSKTRTRHYYPDFLIVKSDGVRQYVEVKPLNRSKKPTVLKKMAVLEQYCIDNDAVAVMLTEIELKAMGCALATAGGLPPVKKKRRKRRKKATVASGKDKKVCVGSRRVDLVRGSVRVKPRKKRCSSRSVQPELGKDKEVSSPKS